MQSASDAFHEAVYEKSPEERILMRFAGSTFFTNEDIQISGGVTVSEAINYEEELTIGACLSSVLEATIINDHRLLSGYRFGDCAVSLGVRTHVDQLDATSANCQMILAYGNEKQVLFEGYIQQPYLRISGVVMKNVQPPFPVYGLLADGRQIYCVSEEGKVWTGTWLDMSVWNDFSGKRWNEVSKITWDAMRGGFLENASVMTLNAFMENKMKRFAAGRRGVAYNAGIAHEFTPGGLMKTFEYVSLGVFRMDIPTKRRTDYIKIQSYDQMIAFDTDASSFLNSLTYPITIKQILHQLCGHVGVPLATTGDFINSGITFTENPITKEDVTCKDILGWIAQAACTVARMTRDGELELAWFGDREVTLPMNQYFDIDVTEREVEQIDALQIASPEDGIDITVGGS